MSYNTEDKIKLAARKVFLEKGFEGTTTREIALEAGSNNSLMNYYFRTKEKLFKAVIRDIMDELKARLLLVINAQNSLQDKIEALLISELHFIQDNPNFTAFMSAEIRKWSYEVMHDTHFKELFEASEFCRQLKEAQADQEVIEIEPLHIWVFILSSVHVLVNARPLIKYMTGGDNKTFSEDHVLHAKHMILNYLYKKEQHSIIQPEEELTHLVH